MKGRDTKTADVLLKVSQAKDIVVIGKWSAGGIQGPDSHAGPQTDPEHCEQDPTQDQSSESFLSKSYLARKEFKFSPPQRHRQIFSLLCIYYYVFAFMFAARY